MFAVILYCCGTVFDIVGQDGDLEKKLNVNESPEQIKTRIHRGTQTEDFFSREESAI